MITRTFKLCLNAGNGSAPYINVNQYDEGETWLFELYSENGERYIPSSGAIVGVKSDGHGIVNTGTVDSEGRVVITETQQMTASAGRAIYELSIDGLTHGTANFIVAVERKPTDDAVMSDSDLSLIQQAVDSAEVIVEVIGDGDPSEVIGEHVDAWLDTHPEATTTVEDGAITAPKINQSLWDKLLVSEEASGNPASFDDGADDIPVSSLKVALEPVQLGSGDPSPSNVRPIIAANGVNLFPPSVIPVGATGYHMASYTADVMEGQTYTISVSRASADKQINYSYKNTDGTYGSDARIIAASETSGKIALAVPSGVVGINVYSPSAPTVEVKVQIERGSSVSPYQPYQGIMVTNAGINQWDEEWVLGGISTITGVPAGGSNVISKNVINVLPNASYFSSQRIRVFFYEHNGTFISYRDVSANTSFVTPANCNKMLFTCFTEYGTTYNNDISINYPSTITDYHAYNGNSYPYTLGQSVYGGTVDLATGVLTVTHFLYEYDGTESFRKSGTALNGFYKQLTTSTPHNWPKLRNYNEVSLLTNECSNMFMPTINVNTYKNNYGYVYFDSGHNFNCDPDLFGTTVDSFAAKLAELYANGTPVSVFCQIAEPQTIQLTPTQVKTLLGYNNISADTGEVEVIYHADTQMYVEKEVNKAKSIIAGIEAEFKATKNYTTGDLLIIGDDLYKCTANIANGSTITVNTNVTKTTVAEQLIALA